jgi:hypothetical protein
MALITGRQYSEVTQTVIACAMRVHTVVGPGVLENPYKLALAVEMVKQR